MLDLARLPRPRREVQGRGARGLGLDRLGGRALQRDRLRRAEDLLRRVRHLVYADNPAVKQAFDTAAGAAPTGLTAKLEQFVDPGWDAGFGSGTFATIACPSWMIGYIKGKAGDAGAGKWNVTALPGGRGANWGGSYLAIPAASPHKEQAAKLITWLTAPEQQARLFTKVGNFPSTTGGIAQVVGDDRPVLRGAPIGKIYSAAAQAAPVQILGPDDGVLKKVMTKALLSVEANGVQPGRRLERRAAGGPPADRLSG